MFARPLEPPPPTHASAASRTVTTTDASSTRAASAADNIGNNVEYGHDHLVFRVRIREDWEMILQTVVIALTMVIMTDAMAEMMASMPRPMAEKIEP